MNTFSRLPTDPDPSRALPGVWNLRWVLPSYAIVIMSGAPFYLVLKLFETLNAHHNVRKGVLAILLGPPVLLALVAAIRELKATCAIMKRDPLLLALLIFCSASLLWSVLPLRTYLEAARLGGWVLVGAYIARRLQGPEVLQVFAGVCAGLALLGGALALLVPEVGTMMKELHHGAWEGPFLHKNHFGAVSALGVLLCLWSSATAMQGRALWFAAALASAGALAGSRSVGGLVFLVAAIISVVIIDSVHSLFGGNGSRRSRWPRIAILVLVLIWIGALMHNASRGVLLRLLNRDTTLSNRTVFWGEVLRLIRQRCWLGHGFGAIWRHRSAASVRYMFGIDSYYAHNGLLEILLDLGMVGALALVAQIGRLLFVAMRSCWREASLSTYGPFAAIAFILTHNIIESSLLRTADTGLLSLLYISIALSQPRSSAAAQGYGSRKRGSPTGSDAKNASGSP